MADERSKGEVETLLWDVLDDGLEDWVHMIEVTRLVRRHAGLTSDHSIRELALDVLELGICTGLLEMGDVTAEAGFIPWSIEPTEAAARLRRRWPPGMPELDMWGIGWARNTATGDELALRERSKRQA